MPKHIIDMFEISIEFFGFGTALETFAGLPLLCLRACMLVCVLLCMCACCCMLAVISLHGQSRRVALLLRWQGLNS